MSKPWTFLGPVLALVTIAQTASAAPASSITQYGVTWTFDAEHETGQFATGDYWVVGPVQIVSVSPAPTGTRNGSCVNPMGGRQGYDDRGGEFATDDQVTFPYVLEPDQSLVSSVSKPEGADVKNAGSMVSQAVLTAVATAPGPGAFRPGYAGDYKRRLDVGQIRWTLLPDLPAPASAPDGAELLAEADRPRADHLSSWTIQNSCAEENWNNGPGQHACYGREVSAFVSAAALYVLLDTPERDELAKSMIQHGIDNYGVLKAGGRWAPNGGHHSGRKWPIVFAGRMLGDCDMLAVGSDYGDDAFGEDGQTYLGETGTALFGWDCGGGQGSYFENGCSGSGAKDCRDPAGLVDACPDYRNCCTSGYWVGQALSALVLGAKPVWNHDAYFDYVDRWMSGGVEDSDGSDAFSEAMWSAYRNDLPPLDEPAGCGDAGAAGGGAGGGSGADAGAGAAGPGSSGGAPGSGGSGTTTGTGGKAVGGTSGGPAGGVPSGDAGDAGPAAGPASGDDGGCGCRVNGDRQSAGLAWFMALLLASVARRRARSLRHDVPPASS